MRETELRAEPSRLGAPTLDPPCAEGNGNAEAGAGSLQSTATPRPALAILASNAKWPQPPRRPALAVFAVSAEVGAGSPPWRQQSSQSQSMADPRPTPKPKRALQSPGRSPQQTKRALESPERSPQHLKRMQSAASAPSEPPPAHILARAARTVESSMTAHMNNDWTCQTCGNVNWFRRGYCIGGQGRCSRPREATWMPGDWFCTCGNHNLKHRTRCNRSRCSLPRARGEILRWV